MKKSYLIISLSLLILFSSCDSLYKLTPGYWKLKSEFKKEREFVQKILDNPDKIQEIIESSEFYDKDVLNMGGFTYKSLMEYLTWGNENAKISNFGRITLYDEKGGIKYDKVKAVHIFNTSQLKIIFIFIESDGKSILAEISQVTV